MKKYIVFFLFIFSLNHVQAQQNIGLHFMDIWQQNNTNPAHFSEEKVSIGLLSLYNNTVFSGATLSEAIRTENGNNLLDINSAIAGMNDQNGFNQNLSLETLNLGLKFGKIGVSLSHALRFDAQYDYPKTFPQAVFQGNAQFIGQTVELGSSIDFKTYNEIALGLAYNTEKFGVGARVKYLAGISSAKTNPDNNSATIYTDPDIYQLTLTADYELQTATFLEYESIDSFNLEFAPTASDIALGGGNTGLAFDLGAQVHLNKLHLSASILDIGSIEWTEEAKTYSTKGTYTYEGLDISNAISGEGVDFQNALDTIQEIFQVKETAQAFTTNLSPQLYLSAKYDFSEKLSFGALLYQRFNELQNNTAIALNAQYQVAKILSVGGTYAIINDKYTNIGINAAAKLGPIQIFALTDNIIGLANNDEEEIVNFRVGVSLGFGK